MRQYLSKILGLTAIVVLSGTFTSAQDNKGKLGENDEIIIRKDGDKDTKVIVEIRDGKLSINGKPYSEYNGDQVIIRKRRNADDMAGRYGVPMPPVPPAPPASPFRGGVYLHDGEFRRNFDADRPFLGVLSEKDENGAKITGVTKESAAEKAGLKEGDVITAINDIKISGPEDLVKTISTFKPEDKITITYNSKDKKGLKAGVVLGKRKGSAMNLPGFEGMQDFNFDFDIDGQNRDGFNFRSAGNPRLGIKAQDLEDGKGAKVLEVDDESNAEKAGIKEGDIITEFEGEKIGDARELAEAARKNRDKSTVTLKINRGGKLQSIEVKIPKKLKTATL